MNITAHIQHLQASIKSAAEKRTAAAKSAMDEGRSLTDDEQSQIDELQSEIDSLRKDVERYQRMLDDDAATAQPVDKSVGNTRHYATPKDTQKLDKGIAFARVARCIGLAGLESTSPVEIAKSMYGDHEQVVKGTERMVRKAAVEPATTSDASWAGNLVNGQPAADFVSWLMPQTIIGQLNMATVPFRQPIITQNSIGQANWVGEGKPIPATSAKFSKATLEPLKVAALAVSSVETLRDSSPAADQLIRNSLRDAVLFRLDTDFIDPSNAGTAGSKPASVTNGVTGTAASGKDAAAIRKDLKAMFATFISANRNPAGAVLVMHPITCLSISLMANDQGTKFFPEVGASGGKLAGLPVIASSYVPLSTASPAKYQIFMVDAANLYYNTGALELDLSRDASVEMSDSPTADEDSVLVSLWQNDLVGFRAKIPVNWAARRANSVARIKDANYGE